MAQSAIEYHFGDSKSSMPELSQSKTTATCYPPGTLYSQWCDHAQQLNMSVSEFVIRMVEAGRKDITPNQDGADSARILRQQLADLQAELDRQRDRNQDLERQLRHTAKVDIVEYVEENPGATTPQIIQHIADTVPGRVAGHLDLLEGEDLRCDGEAYYPLTSDA